MAFCVDNRKSKGEALRISLSGLEPSAHFINTAQPFLWIRTENMKARSSAVLYPSPYLGILHYQAVLLVMPPEIWGVLLSIPQLSFFLGKGSPLPPSPAGSGAFLRCGTIGTASGGLQSWDQGRAGARAGMGKSTGGGCTSQRPSCLREMKQAKGASTWSLFYLPVLIQRP